MPELICTKLCGEDYFKIHINGRILATFWSYKYAEMMMNELLNSK